MKTTKNRVSYLFPMILILIVAVAAICLTPVMAQNNKSDKEKAPAKAEKVIVIDEDGNRTTYYTDELPSSVRKTIEGAVASGGRTTGNALRLADEVLRDLNISGLTREVTRTLSEVRLSDFTAEVDRAIAAIDWEGVNMEVDRTMLDLHDELNNPRLKKNIKNRLAAVQDDLARAADDMGNDIASARDELVAARRELASARKADPTNTDLYKNNLSDNSYEAMLEELEADGLIDKTRGFKINKSGDDLLINGKAPTEKVYNKYNRFLKGKDVTISGDKDGTTVKLK